VIRSKRRWPELRPRRSGQSWDISTRTATVLVLLLAAYYTLPWLLSTQRDWNLVQKPSWEGAFAGTPEAKTEQICDIDTWLIHHGVIAAPRFRDTLAWWHGPWAGQVKFYRPIPSYAFWIDWKLFGNHESRYTLLPILLHLAAVGSFVCLSSALFRYFRLPRPGLTALLSGAIFVDGLYLLGVRQQTNLAVFTAWKNMPESLVTLFYCLSFRSYLKLVCEDEERVAGPPAHPHASRAILCRSWPVLWYLAACASKEAGVLLPLLAIVIEWPHLKCRGSELRRAVQRMAPLLAALPIFLLLRSLFLGTIMGFRYGSNGSWQARVTDNLAGALSLDLRSGRYGPVVLGTCLFITMSILAAAMQKPTVRSRDRMLLAALLMSLITPAVGSLLCNLSVAPGSRPAVLVMQAVDGGNLPEVAGIAIFLLSVVHVFRFRPLLGIFSYAWILGAVALLIFTPSAIHRAYLMEGGFAILAAAGITQWRTERDGAVPAGQEQATT